MQVTYYYALMGLMITTWFAILFPLLRPHRLAPLTESPPAPPGLLVVAFSFLPILFLVQRSSGTAVLEEGLTISNVITLAVLAGAGLYLAWALLKRPLIGALPLDRITFPFYLAIAINIASALWSVVPSYTLYRAVELGIMFTVALLIFDRSSFERSFLWFHAALIGVWMLVHADEIVLNLANGIVFSSAKNNLTPLVCVSVLLFLATASRLARVPLLIAALAAVGFIVGGSAATAGAIPLALTGLLIASGQTWVRRLGIVIACAGMTVFIVLLFALDSFPGLMELISQILQKPMVELERATGRGEFWPIFLEASAGRHIGSGYAAGERFIQLLISPAAVQERLGRTDVFIASAHNMVIGVWVATGWLGLLTMVTCLGLAWREAMRLDRAGRRFVLPMLLLIAANGMTVPGIFGEFNLHTMTWAALLAFMRARLLSEGESVAVQGVARRQPWVTGRQRFAPARVRLP